MALLNIFPSGEMDKDTDSKILASGDYSDARNIVISTGKNGGADTIKALESIKSIGLASSTGTLKATYKAANGLIYALYKTNSTTATLFVISQDRTTITNVLAYTHTVSVDFTPDLRVIGDNIVWNYYGSGKILYWNTTRTNGATPTLSDLLLAKAPPISGYAIEKALVSNESVNFLELNDFQFASRYKYDNGEYSTMSAYSEIFKGAKNTSSYTFTFNNTNKPSYATEIEVYCRIGNSGTWRRILTTSVTSVPSNYVWKGQYFESLSDNEANEVFSAVPDTAGSIEVAIDRMFIADYTDDFNDDSVGEIVLSTSNGYTLPTGGAIKNYFGVDTTDAGVNSQEVGTYVKPFANNSQYSVGIAFFDSAKKTRGVEFITRFSTGIFESPVAPTISINTSGYTKPSYAKWGQLCITKNLSKSNTFEGFASSVYFDIEEEQTDATSSAVSKVVINKSSVIDSDVSKVKNLVVDISGLYKSGHIYSFQSGDRILINIPDGVEAGSTKVGSYRVLDLQVNYGDSQKIYCNWIGGSCMNNAIPDATKLHFEIYSIRQQSEEANTLFYGIGDLFDVSTSIPSTISNYHIGDAVFKKVSFAQYTETPLQQGFVKSKPAIIDSGAVTLSRAGKGISDVTAVVAIDASSDTFSTTFYPLFTTFGTNEDEATAVGGGVILKGFYDSISTINFKNNFDIVETTAFAIGGTGEGGIQITIEAVVVRRPFNQATQSFGAEIEITNKALIYDRKYYSDEYGSGDTAEVFSDDTQMQIKPNTVLGAGDELKVKLISYTIKAGSDPIQGEVSLKGKNGFDNYITLTIIGDRIQPNSAYFAKTNVTVSATKTDFVVRAMSNSLENLTGWNTSVGKPYLRATDKISQRMTNSIRSSGNLIVGTSVNNIGKFSTLDTFDVPVENGRIVSLQRASRLQGDGDMLLAICENESSYILLGESSMNQSSNNEFSALSSGIIGSIRNLGDRVGVVDKTSVYNYNGDIYWWDNKKKNVCQFTKNGLRILSDRKVKSEFIKKDGVAKLTVDPFYKLLLVNIGSESVGYDIEANKWRGYYDISFDNSVSDGDRVLFFKSGLVYRSLENASGNKIGEYFGETYAPYVSLSLNTIIPVLPQNIILSHSMNVTDYSRDNNVKVSLFNILITNENGQESEIKEVNFLLENNKLYAHILRDRNSGSLINGRYMIGYSNLFKLTLKDYSQENRIFAIEVNFDNVTGH